ncbi:MAG: BsuBI/PstI family type II restriction endonuclease [Nitrospiraceae bacterium]|nr:BsuBI/PstI family type II restriction endonuclease [Nitrospiraceae bacterium]
MCAQISGASEFPNYLGHVTPKKQEIDSLLDRVDLLRLQAMSSVTEKGRLELGQVFTPKPVAKLMASFFPHFPENIRLLDPGAGIGSLTAAVVAEIKNRQKKPKTLEVHAYEKDPFLIDSLTKTLHICQDELASYKVKFSFTIFNKDFIESASEILISSPLFMGNQKGGLFNSVILNPPYRKINAETEERRLFSRMGIETTNLYSGFLTLSIRLLEDHGILVAITPRSFCNGTYFRSFREEIIKTTNLRRFHVFEKRDTAFSDDNVLQENIVMVVEKGAEKRGEVVISSSANGDNDEDSSERNVAFDTVVYPKDGYFNIHLPTDLLKDQATSLINALPHRLSSLGLKVSTGKVVDFRVNDFIVSTDKITKNVAPLLYSHHLENGLVSWPKFHPKKADGLRLTRDSLPLFVPSGNYIFIKRFSAKEERKRIVASLCEGKKLYDAPLGIENHLNYIHANGGGLPLLLAKGLCLWFNSTIVDTYFRIFSGHTQVNADDLRRIPIPSLSQLQALGNRWHGNLPDQQTIDLTIRSTLFNGAEKEDPSMAVNKINEALSILKALEFPREQINERSALTLLALLNMTPQKKWSEAESPLMGITPMMNFFEEHYGKQYKPNTRETVRRQTVHQFVEACLAIANPDKKSRPTTSPQYVYQIDAFALELIKQYGLHSWEKSLKKYMDIRKSLTKKYAMEREMERITVTTPQGKKIYLSPGGQNELIASIFDEFLPRFAPGGYVIYIGDTGRGKDTLYDKEYLAKLGVNLDKHGKFPDAIVHFKEKNWLLLIEAVTSHGPVDAKRHGELKALFSGSTAGLVFVTTFLTKKDMVKYLRKIAWETEVWIAESPTHMIHFNGERFLGPY